MSVRPYYGLKPQEEKRKEESLPPSRIRNGSDLKGRVKAVEGKTGDERARPLLSDHINPVAPLPSVQAQTRVHKGRGHVMPVVQQGDTPRPEQQKISPLPAGPQPNRVRVNGGHTVAPVNQQRAPRQPGERPPSRIPVGKPNQRRAD